MDEIHSCNCGGMCLDCSRHLRLPPRARGISTRHHCAGLPRTFGEGSRGPALKVAELQRANRSRFPW